MNQWGNNWQQPYYPQPHPHAYVPPPTFGQPAHQPAHALWSPAWNPQAYEAQRAQDYQSKKYPNLNPILASDSTLLRFDVKKKPRDGILSTTYLSSRHSPAFATPVTSMRVISKAFPWTIDIVSQTPVTCEAVWDSLYTALQEPIADSEWGLIVGDKKRRETMEKAAKKRVEGKADTTIRRIDYLGDSSMFKGLDKDEEFEKSRLLPGTGGITETWVVKFG